jgi:hypothetical protein
VPVKSNNTKLANFRLEVNATVVICVGANTPSTHNLDTPDEMVYNKRASFACPGFPRKEILMANKEQGKNKDKDKKKKKKEKEKKK